MCVKCVTDHRPPDGKTEGHRTTASAALCTASRGKNDLLWNRERQ